MGMSTIFELLKAEHKNLYFNTDSEFKNLSVFLLEFWVASTVKYKHLIPSLTSTSKRSWSHA